MTPKIYLISRDLTDDQRLQVQQALSITPLSAVIITDPRDAKLAAEFCQWISSLQQPIAILADFDDPLTAIQEDGSLCPLLSQSNQL